jgi:predicted nucleotidyltransferase
VDGITQTILAAYPDTQAIYLFGSWGTENEWPDSDADIAVLLPPGQAKQTDFSAWIALTTVQLSELLRRDVDLINLRRVSTVFQKEIIMADRRIYCSDEYAADEFEMLVLSFYQKLNEERREILSEGLRSGSFYQI